MGQNFIRADRDQVLLLAPDLREWLPADHLARFVIEMVEQLDLSAIYGAYRSDGHGRAAHDPAMMVALVLYAYSVGVTSSRRIERRCVEDVAFRVIAANQQPDHATIARFLVRHREALSGLFFQVLALCQRAGMLSVGTVAIDSTKLAANASARKNRTFEGLKAEAARIIEEAIETDEREDELYGERCGDELPQELADPRTRKARIKELLQEARREQELADAARAEKLAQDRRREQTPRGQRTGGRPLKPEGGVRQRALWARKYNLTDPDSSVVRHRGMLMQGYGIQTAVNERQVILSARAGGGIDQGQLTGTVARARQTLQRLGVQEPIGEVLADSGYWNSHQITQLQGEGMRVLIPPRRVDKNQIAQQLRAELADPQAAGAYRRRAALIEPVFAHWKHIRTITRLYKRGQTAVQAEIDLIATTHNLLKLRTALQAG